jgi:hypothetical protein
MIKNYLAVALLFILMLALYVLLVAPNRASIP